MKNTGLIYFVNMKDKIKKKISWKIPFFLNTMENIIFINKYHVKYCFPLLKKYHKNTSFIVL